MEKQILPLPFKISCLIFITNKKGDNLLIKRNKSPNKNCWSPIGGKLDMHLGESPYECAKRESYEEIGLGLEDEDLNLFGYVSEKNYEGGGHWLMFLFEIIPPISTLPKTISEGTFKFFSRPEIDSLNIPQTDHELVWPYFDKRKLGFWGIRANFESENPKIKIEAKPK